MQQPELLPAHYPAGFSICELMAERHRTVHCFFWREEATRQKKIIRENILRDKVRVVAQRVFQFLQKGNVAGLAGSQAFFILQLLAWFIWSFPSTALCSLLITSLISPTRMEMMPLCFSSIRSQMILLSKYFTVSHWNTTFGRENLTS